jgi:DNA-binding NarL/FixJ family response regulator
VAPAVDETRESILGWIEAGVSGYETTNSSSSELIQALHTAARGERSCSQRVMSMVIRRLSTLAASPRAVSAQRDNGDRCGASRVGCRAAIECIVTRCTNPRFRLARRGR